MSRSYPRISTFKTAEQFRRRLEELGVDLPCDDAILQGRESPLGQPISWEARTIGNRWAIHPMEGWDGTPEGLPTEFTLRRWHNFGQSGAKLIWGGEAVAVRHDGRANPNQLLINRENLSGMEKLRDTLVSAHVQKVGSAEDLLIGLQLTHSGRFSRPNEKARPEPRTLFRHPILDPRVGIESDREIMTDEEIEELIEDFIRAAKLSREVGFDFVDLKHCHGYLGHEFLGAHTRPGRFGGSFENRTRFLRLMVEGIRKEVPDLGIGVRLSSFDFVPFKPNPEETTEKSLGRGIPETAYEGRYCYGFGLDPTDPTYPVMEDSIRFVQLLAELGISLVNVTCGSPYYNPHIQRPALFPPSDGYQPPEDPLIGAGRLIGAARAIKRACPQALVVGTGFTYLQDFIPQVGQAVVREGWMDFIGIGRMVLSYPEMPYDSLTQGALDRKKICRTFSDCTTAPRKGLISGCYPLDPFYKESEEGLELRKLKGLA
jgi:2,4-dienoyl-CoA reductase-like NADH-dependent reductase (Old Yellow Enzyme family)